MPGTGHDLEPLHLAAEADGLAQRRLADGGQVEPGVAILEAVAVELTRRRRQPFPEILETHPAAL